MLLSCLFRSARIINLSSKCSSKHRVSARLCLMYVFVRIVFVSCSYRVCIVCTTCAYRVSARLSNVYAAERQRIAPGGPTAQARIHARIRGATPSMVSLTGRFRNTLPHLRLLPGELILLNRHLLSKRLLRKLIFSGTMRDHLWYNTGALVTDDEISCFYVLCI